MVKEEIIKDLSARLPYGVMVSINGSSPQKLRKIEYIGGDYAINDIMTSDVKAYLLPLESMSDKDKEDFNKVIEAELFNDVITEGPSCNATILEVDFYNENHYDYRNLNKTGDAIDSTNLNLY